MMLKNYNKSVEINRNPNWFYIPDHLYSILINGGSESGKKNVLINLIKHQRTNIDKNIFVRQKSIRIKVSITH